MSLPSCTSMRAIFALILCAFCPVVLLGQVTEEPINHAVDPGFEDGTAFTDVGSGAPGWNNWTTFDVFVDDYMPHTGTYSATLPETFSQNYQEVGYGQWVTGLVPDATYVMTAFASIDYYDPNDSMQWGLYIGVQNFGRDKVQTIVFDYEFTPVILLFTMGADCTGADIWAWRGPGGEARSDDYGVWDYHNYLVNADFETNDFTGWDYWNYNSAITADEPHSGTSATVILDGEGGFAQLIPNLLPGATYGMKGFAKVANEGDMAWWGVKNYGSDQVDVEVTQTDYTEGNISFTMGAENTTAEVFFWKESGGQAYCDDFLVCKMIDAPGAADVSRHRTETLPDAFTLQQNYPNPFNSETTIRYELDAAGQVNLAVYDVTGQLVQTLVHDWQSAGSQQVRWDGRDAAAQPLSSGVYILRLQVTTLAGLAQRTRKMTLLQ
ncbi:T9SS type A sorting domain-containing protein [candidate division KSB1 bacterium]|nr:T9SS type A sorting domain-containing protein [candidate division KSB1 bacterium]RQW03414.1 MAG: T9SS C-terminal target domain-containing protein [candidate division KSB1 bacterium]